MVKMNKIDRFWSDFAVALTTCNSLMVKTAVTSDDQVTAMMMMMMMRKRIRMES